MKTKKQISKRNRRMIIATAIVLLVVLIIFNLHDLLDGFKEGARAASGY
jgi:uncharacterized protein YoxC